MPTVLKVNNFRGIASAEITLSDQVTLLCAANHQGKTSMLQAAQCALTSAKSIPGVPATKAGQLVKSGTTAGSARIENENGWTQVNWPTCKVEGNGSGPSSSAFAAGTFGLMDLDQEKRSAEILKITKAEPTAEDLEAALKSREVSEDRIAGELAMVFGVVDDKGRVLRAPKGWDAACEAAETQGRTLKAKFEAASGIRWGSKQAQEWLPAGWEEDLTAASVDRLEEEVTHAKAALEGAIAAEAIGAHEKEKLESKAGALEKLTQKAAELDAKMKELAENVTALENNPDKPRSPGPQGFAKEYTCPHCAGAFQMKGDKAVLVDEKKINQEELRLAQQAVADYQKVISDAKNERDAATMQYHQNSARLTEAKQAQQKLDELAGKTGDAQAVEAAREDLRRAEARLNAVIKKTEVEKIVNSVLHNQRVIDLLAADGLRKTKLVQGLEAFNARLKELSQIADWCTVSINNDLAVEYGLRAYGTLSASEQFRADVTVQCALAELTNSSQILIDASEILDGRGKNGLFTLLATITIPSLVAMTCGKKVVPDLSGMGGAVYWVEDGTVKQFEGVTA